MEGWSVAAPVSHPMHPDRYSPTSGSCGSKFGKSMVSSYLACCKDVHCHPLSCWHPGGAGPAAHPTHRGLSTDACHLPAALPAARLLPAFPQLTTLRCLSLASLSQCLSMCTFWEAREWYLNSLSARNWVSILAMSSWNISEKGEVAAKARMDLCGPAELLGWPASKITPPPPPPPPRLPM